MDVNIRGRNVRITDRFEDYVSEKTEKIAQLLPKAQEFEVRVSRLSDRSPQHGDRVEITLIGPGPVIRAESTAGDKYSAFDIAYGRILERVRRHKDKQKIHPGRNLTSLHEAASAEFKNIDITPASAETIAAVAEGRTPVNGEEQQSDEYSPVVIRTKEFEGERMTVDQAVDRMELVGHDFFLFIDAENDRSSVVYRRKGWNYGVISLTDQE